MQIRFCPNCDYKKRDDEFEINRARRNCNVFWDEECKCPKCKTWLWSVILEPDFVEINDWDENSIHGTKEDLKKTLSNAIKVMDEYC